MPRHAVPELIDLDLPLAITSAHARDSDLANAVHHRNGDHGAAATNTAPSDLDVIIIAVKKATAMSRGRGILHLHGEPGTGIHGAALAKGVGDLVGIDSVKRGADTDALLLSRLIDDDKLGLLGLGDVAEEGEAVFVLRLRLGGNGVGVVGHGRSGIVHCGSHGGAAYGRVWWVTTRVAGEDMTLSDILRRAMSDLSVCDGIPSITYRTGRKKLASRFDRWAKMICDAKVT